MQRTVLLLGARAPVALHLTRLLCDAGVPVIVADSLHQSLAFASERVRAREVLPSPNHSPDAYAAAVSATIDRHGITDVIPTCEEVFHLAMLWEKIGTSSQLHAPDISLLAEVHNKHSFIQMAENYGLEVPKTILLQCQQDLDAIRSELKNLVLKPVWSRFATDVKIRPNWKDLKIVLSADQPWIAQEALGGDEICAYAIASQGKMTALSIYQSDYRAGKGAGIYFRPAQEANVRYFVEKFITKSNWHGQISFDFIRSADGSIKPLECNPRATSGVHFFADGKAMVGALFNGLETQPTVTTPQTLPLAMWYYAAFTAFREGRWRAFLKDLQAAENILQWPTDGSASIYQWRALAEIAFLAVRNRQSLQAAATEDIEWNGFQSSI